MAIEESVFIRKLRTNTGAQTTPSNGGDGMSNDQILDCVAEACRAMSRYLDRRTLEFVTAAAGQQSYVVTSDPKPAYVHEVPEAPAASIDSDDFLFDAGESGATGMSNDPGVSYLDNPSVYEAMLQDRKHARRIPIHDFTYRPETGTLTVIPPPSTAGDKIYYVAGYVHTLASAPSHYESVLLKFAEAEVLRALAAIRMRTPGITATGFPSYGDSRLCNEMADQREKKAKEMAMEEAALEGRRL